MPKAVSPQYPGNAASSEIAANPASTADVRDSGALPLVILGLDLKLLCGKCGAKLIIDVRWQGRELNCPNCETAAVVPQYWQLLGLTDASPEAASAAGPAATPSRLSEAEIAFLSEPGEIVPRVAEQAAPRLDGAPAPEIQRGLFVRAVLPGERNDVQGDDTRRVAALASRDE